MFSASKVYSGGENRIWYLVYLRFLLTPCIWNDLPTLFPPTKIASVFQGQGHSRLYCETCSYFQVGCDVPNVNGNTLGAEFLSILFMAISPALGRVPTYSRCSINTSLINKFKLIKLSPLWHLQPSSHWCHSFILSSVNKYGLPVVQGTVGNAKKARETDLPSRTLQSVRGHQTCTIYACITITMPGRGRHVAQELFRGEKSCLLLGPWDGKNIIKWRTLILTPFPQHSWFLISTPKSSTGPKLSSSRVTPSSLGSLAVRWGSTLLPCLAQKSGLNRWCSRMRLLLAEHVWLAGGNVCERLPFRRGVNQGTVPTQRRSSFSHRISWRVFAPILLSEPEAESGDLTFDSFKYHFLIFNKNTDILTLNSAGSTGTDGYRSRYVQSSENRLLSTTTCLLTFLSMANHFCKIWPTSLLNHRLPQIYRG